MYNLKNMAISYTKFWLEKEKRHILRSKNKLYSLLGFHERDLSGKATWVLGHTALCYAYHGHSYTHALHIFVNLTMQTPLGLELGW